MLAPPVNLHGIIPTSAQEIKPLTMNSQPLGSSSRAVQILSVVISVAAFAGYCSFPIHEPGFWGILLRGDWIREHGALPQTRFWEADGAPWRDASWLAAATLSGLWSWLGAAGAAWFKLAGVGALLLALGWRLAQLSGSWFLALLLAAVVSSSAAPLFAAGVLPWALALLCCADGLAARWARSGSPRDAALLFATLVLHGNFHPSVLPAAVLAVAGAAHRRRSALVLAAAALCCTPYAGRQLLTAAGEFLQEAAFVVATQAAPATVYHYDFVTLILLLAILAALRPAAIAADRLVAALAALLAAGAWRELLPYALLFNSLLLAAVWRDGAQSHIHRAVSKLEAGVLRLPALGVVWVMLCLAIVNLVGFLRAPVSSVGLPVAAATAIAELQPPRPVVSRSEFAPYLAQRWRGTGLRPVAAHARSERVREQQYFGLGPGFAAAQEQLAPRTVLCNAGDPLFFRLISDAQWRPIYVEPPAAGGAKARNWAVFSRRE